MSDSTTSISRGVAAITEVFRSRRQNNQHVFIPYIMAGDPDLGTTEKIVRSLSGIGVDLIELGMPFSDPLADGPVIQRAGERALRQGLSMKKLLRSIETMRLSIDTPIIIMTYYNLFYHFGLKEFAREAARVGVDGVIVPDLPPEEADEFRDALDEYNLALVYLIAPTSSEERIRKIGHVARGFVYYVSRTGVTGEQKDLSADLAENLKKIRSIISLPVVVGFGVSNPEQAKMIAQYADGVVIGSAIVRLIEETDQLPERMVAIFLRPFVDGLHDNEHVN
ncbi:MAG: tryptophan synthase subunit alpha [Candidatus Omnitrophota bacterium]|jgi:tryptophan synthase alpha chain|nr:MAG: tryptophan synthase subunit alpha [Candidatus Omnitrophota bacterium]